MGLSVLHTPSQPPPEEGGGAGSRRGQSL